MPEKEDIDHDWDYDYEYEENETYEWKQWVGFKKLHAVRRWDRNEGGYDTHIASCGVAQTQFDIFVEPPIATLKCKNCERGLNGK